ncbi:DNA-directed RNA polymerase subunit beta', partial [Alkalihalophilus lindianensis]|nr:DNA-directed RNA polymerase subunit beta' [Alkalihalophilus lindianensis]
VREDDCGTDRGFSIRALKDGTEIIESLEERLIGRYARNTIKHPETKEVLVRENELITEDIAEAITAAGIEEVKIRSAFTCNTRHG